MGEPPRAEDPEALSLWMCMLVPMDTQSKMRLLSSTDTADRLETVLRQFSTAGLLRTAAPAGTGSAGEGGPSSAASMVRTLESAVATIRAALSGGGLGAAMGTTQMNGGDEADDDEEDDNVAHTAGFTVAEETFPYENDDEEDEDEDEWEDVSSGSNEPSDNNQVNDTDNDNDGRTEEGEEEESELNNFHDPNGAVQQP